MASMQKSREERARSAAQKAADELAASRRDHQVHDHEAAPAVSPRGRGGDGGILSSVLESARTVMGAVRGTFSGARDDDHDDDTTAARGATTAAAVERAKEYAVEAKEGARLALAGDAVARKGETDESAWQQGQAVRRRAAEKAHEEAQRVHEPSEEEKGRAATENIIGSAKGAMAGAFADKMVMPTDVVERKRAEAAAGGGWNGKVASPAAGIRGDDDGRRQPDDEEEEDVMLRVKDADQMTGQMFNDVGKMGGEGTGMPRRR